MFSNALKETLEREVVGQPQAVNAVVRGITRLRSGLTPIERSWCAYLLLGPPGTGRTHLVRSVARTLRGDDLVSTLNCNPGMHADPLLGFVQQLAPLFAASQTPGRSDAPPHVILVQDLECARKELFPVLARMLETGQLPVPSGGQARLNNCFLFFTSGLCAAQILDESSGIGFTGASVLDDDEGEKNAIAKVCRAESETAFGTDFLAQLDNLIIFRKLEEEHLACVLERHFERMARWLDRRGVSCEMLPAARTFILERANGQAMQGARHLIQIHRHEVEFPVADLLLSGELGAGVRLIVDHRPDEPHLHFTVRPPEEEVERLRGAHEIPVSAGAI